MSNTEYSGTSLNRTPGSWKFCSIKGGVLYIQVKPDVEKPLYNKLLGVGSFVLIREVFYT